MRSPGTYVTPDLVGGIVVTGGSDGAGKVGFLVVGGRVGALVVGALVGNVPAMVGPIDVGALVGALVGILVGILVGALVGILVGALVGGRVGGDDTRL